MLSLHNSPGSASPRLKGTFVSPRRWQIICLIAWFNFGFVSWRGVNSNTRWFVISKGQGTRNILQKLIKLRRGFQKKFELASSPLRLKAPDSEFHRTQETLCLKDNNSLLIGHIWVQREFWVSKEGLQMTGGKIGHRKSDFWPIHCHELTDDEIASNFRRPVKRLSF